MAALALLHDDATWWLNGRPDLYPGARTLTKPELADAWNGFFGNLEGGLHMPVRALVAHGLNVAAETSAHAVLRKGGSYDNGYLLLFELRDGRIAAVREYTDLLTAQATFS